MSKNSPREQNPIDVPRGIWRYITAIWTVLVGLSFVVITVAGYVLGIVFTQVGPLSLGFYFVWSFLHLILQLIFASLNRIVVVRRVKRALDAGFQPGASKISVGYNEEEELYRASVRAAKNLTYEGLKLVIFMIDGNESPLSLTMAEIVREETGAAVIDVDYVIADHVFLDRSTGEGYMTPEGVELERQLAEQVMQAAAENRFVCIRQPHRGKRPALYTAIRMTAYFDDVQINTHMDSDTLPYPDEVTMLVYQYVDPRVVGVTGNVEVLYSNVLSYASFVRYAGAFHLERASQSFLGVVYCESGPSSSYLKSEQLRIINRWLVEEFFGQRPEVGEDRQETRMVSEYGGYVVFTHQAVVLSETPTKFWRWILQQIRWGRSFFREGLRTIRNAWRYGLLRGGWLTYELSYQTFFPFIVMISIIATLTRAILFGEWLYVAAWILTIVFPGVIRGVYLVTITRRLEYAAFPMYGFFYISGQLWTKLFALATVHKSRSWVTQARGELGDQRHRMPQWLKIVLLLLLLVLLASVVSLIQPAGVIP